MLMPKPDAPQIELKEQIAVQEAEINKSGSLDLKPLAQTKLEVEKTLQQADFAAAALGGQRRTN